MPFLQVQNDETLIPYSDVVDQVTTGHEFLRKTLNVTVQQGWQLDMFTGMFMVLFRIASSCDVTAIFV